MDTIILIPAYNPTPAMAETAKQLFERGFTVLIVNDGSSPGYSDIFLESEKYAEIIGYEKNGGKGAALKYGFRHIMTHMRRQYNYVITCDADGQHAVGDIIKVNALLHVKGNIVIGSRDFSGDVPFRSRLGNTLSRFAYTIETSRYIRDNQSGLRGFETSYCEWLLGIKGEKYDYEINVLMYAAKQNIPVYETTIETIYIENNRSSHFDPVRDTLRLHAKMLMASFPSICAVAVFLFAFFMLVTLIPPIVVSAAVSLAGGAGIVASVVFNAIHFYSSGTIKYSFPLNAVIVSIVRTGGYALLMTLFVYILRMSDGFSLFLSMIIVLPVEYYLLRMIGKRRICDDVSMWNMA